MKKRYRWPLWMPIVVIAVLVALRLALPYIVRDVLNKRMDRMGDYHGHVADVDLNLWRGAYSLNDLSVVKVSGKLPVPLLDTRSMDIALSWDALMHGAIRASVDFYHPVLNFVDGNDKTNSQAGRGVDWRKQLEELIPIRIDEVNVHDGTVTFHNFVSKPRVDLKATDVQASITNLTNANGSKGSRVASMRATAEILGEAPLESTASFDPLGDFRDFKFTMRVLRIQLTRLNDLARAYAGLDFASGHGDFVMELNAREGQLQGYAKPLFKDMKIFSWQQDVKEDKENPFRVAWEAVVQGVTWVFKNHKADQFATRVPIHGRIDNRKIGTWKAIVNVLHNAFVEAYKPQLEHLGPAPRDDGD